MDKKHRNILNEAEALADKLIEMLEPLLNDRQEYVTERPETWEDSEKGTDYVSATEQIETALDTAVSLKDSLGEVDQD